MPSLIIAPEAKQDLIEIWLYIAKDSPINASNFVKRLEDQALQLAEFTEIGVDKPELGPNLKSFPVARYVLYYEPREDGIELLRVLRGSRDTSQLF